MIRALLILLFLALPAHANDIFVCIDQDWEVTVAFTEDGGCILDNVEGEVMREADVVTCTTENPPQTFRLTPDHQFAYRGHVSYPDAEDEAVQEGNCSRS